MSVVYMRILQTIILTCFHAKKKKKGKTTIIVLEYATISGVIFPPRISPVRSWARATVLEEFVHFLKFISPPPSCRCRFPLDSLVPLTNVLYVGLAILPCEFVRVYARGALKCTVVPFRLYSHLTPSIPGMDSGFPTARNREKWLLKMDEWT